MDNHDNTFTAFEPESVVHSLKLKPHSHETKIT